MEEYLDICDQEGNLTGESKLRSKVHEDGDWHRTAHVLIFNSKGEVLLQRRSKTKDSYPDCFDISSGGHVESGKTIIETALIELKEELGISTTEDCIIELGTVKDQDVLNGGTYINNSLNTIYALQLDLDIGDFVLQKEEVQYVEWSSFDEIKEWIKDGKEDFVYHPGEYELLEDHMSKTGLK